MRSRATPWDVPVTDEILFAAPVLVHGEFCITPPHGCQRHGCGKPLTARQRRWCSTECREWHYRNHVWNVARHAALVTRGEGNPNRATCVQCGSRTQLEVDHIIPRNGTPLSEWSCLHHQENLRVLCHSCHVTRRLWDPADPVLIA